MDAHSVRGPGSSRGVRLRTPRPGRTLRAMDGLLRSVGDGISGLVSGALAAIGSALQGMVDAVSSALPAGVLPVLGVGLALLVLWLIVKR